MLVLGPLASYLLFGASASSSMRTTVPASELFSDPNEIIIHSLAQCATIGCRLNFLLFLAALALRRPVAPRRRSPAAGGSPLLAPRGRQRVGVSSQWLREGSRRPVAGGSSRTRDRTSVPRIARWTLNLWTPREALNGYLYSNPHTQTHTHTHFLTGPLACLPRILVIHLPPSTRLAAGGNL